MAAGELSCQLCSVFCRDSAWGCTSVGLSLPDHHNATLLVLCEGPSKIRLYLGRIFCLIRQLAG